ncbi:LysR family transcriptional regulator [Chitinimonas sp.]|uniref:LysR family transcriptional regulator n=1 Tax=Chitinimonas sp. TaxID=1934313 RepID=UPI0035AE6654
MKLSLESLLVIDAIDRCGTFAAAASELHRVPSSLSYLVQKLESDLGVTVFDRSGHRAKLTATGALLLGEGRRLLHAASTLEARARRVETGWETELRIAVDAIVPFQALLPYIAAFYGERSFTRLRFSHEVLGGGWDALFTERADLVVGAVGDPPPLPGFAIHAIGELASVFCVANGHPLAAQPQPLDGLAIAQHRVVAIGDTSHRLPPRDLNLTQGQDCLVVPNLDAKLHAILAGLGVGHLPRCLADPHIAAGRLQAMQLKENRPPLRFHLAWKADDKGRALAWWVKQLNRVDFMNEVAGLA